MTYRHVAAAVFLLALGGPAACAADARVVQSDALAHATGGQAMPWFEPASAVPVTAGEDVVLPANGGEAIVQTAASLPDGFSDGTAAYTQARSVARYFAAREAARQHLAATVPGGFKRG